MMLNSGVVRKKDLYITLLTIYFICLPLDGMVLGSIGSPLKLIAIPPLALAVFCARKIRLNSLIKSLLLYLAFVLLSCLWSINPSMSVSRCVSIVLLFALTLSSAVFEYDDYDIFKLKRALLWSTRSTAMVMLLTSEFKYGRFILGGKIDEDPNYLCGFLFAGIIYIIQKIINKEYRARDIVEFIIYAVLVLLTGSRGGLIAITVSAVAYFLFGQESESKNTIRNIGILLLIIFLMVFSVNFLPAELQARFNLIEAVASGGTGRTDIWTRGIEIFRDSTLGRQLFGIGTGTITQVLIMTFYGRTSGYVMHNIYLETLLELGIVGLFVYMHWIITFLRTSYRQTDKFACFVMLGIAILALTTSLDTFKPYFNIMLLIIAQSNRQCLSDE